MKEDQSLAEKEIKGKLLNEKPVETLVMLRRKGPSYPRRLSQDTDTTYSHMVRLLEDLKDHGLVTHEKKGRKKVYTLTRKGQQLGEKLMALEEAPGINFSSGNENRSEDRKTRPKLEDSLREKYV